MHTPHRPTLYCCICSRALPPGTEAHACQACTHRMRGYLATIVAELPELQACLRPGAAPTGGRGAGRAHSPMPLRLDVLNLLGPGYIGTVREPGEQTGVLPLLPLLDWWTNYIARQHFTAWRTGGTVWMAPCEGAATQAERPSCSCRSQRRPRRARSAEQVIAAWCRWLAAYLPYAITQPWVHQLDGDLAEAVAAVRDITRSVPQRHVRLAPCPRCEVTAMVAVDGVWEIVCEACRYRMEPDAYARHAAEVLPEQHAELADAMAAVPPSVPLHHPRTIICPRCSAGVAAPVDAEHESACEACGYRIRTGPDASTTHASAAPPDASATPLQVTAVRQAEDAA